MIYFPLHSSRACAYAYRRQITISPERLPFAGIARTRASSLRKPKRQHIGNLVFLAFHSLSSAPIARSGTITTPSPFPRAPASSGAQRTASFTARWPARRVVMLRTATSMPCLHFILKSFLDNLRDQRHIPRPLSSFDKSPNTFPISFSLDAPERKTAPQRERPCSSSVGCAGKCTIGTASSCSSLSGELVALCRAGCVMESLRFYWEPMTSITSSSVGGMSFVPFRSLCSGSWP